MRGKKYPGNWYYSVMPKALMSIFDNPNAPGYTPEYARKPVFLTLMTHPHRNIEFVLDLLAAYVRTYAIPSKGPLEEDLEMIKKVIDHVKLEIASLKDQKEAITAQIAELEGAQKYINDQIIVMMDKANVTLCSLPDGTRVSIRTNPGTLTSKKDPTIEDLTRYGEKVVKSKYSWNLMGIKEGLLSGDIDHEFMDKEGFEFNRTRSIRFTNIEE